MHAHTKLLPLFVLGVACTGAPLTPAELCDSVDAQIGGIVEVRGFTGFALTSHGAIACDPEGSCCNPAIFAPLIDCADGPDIVLVPSAEYQGATDPFRCEGLIDNAPLSDGRPPSAECAPPTCPGFPWTTAIGTLEAETFEDPVTGAPMRRLAVDSFTAPTR